MLRLGAPATVGVGHSMTRSNVSSNLTSNLHFLFKHSTNFSRNPLPNNRARSAETHMVAAMLFTALSTAQRIEKADIVHLTQQAKTCAGLFPDNKNIATQAVGGGVAAFTLPIFGRKLNHVVGFGMNEPVSRSDLLAVEALYSSLELATEIDLCPYSHSTALQALAEGGYSVNDFVNVYAREITDADLHAGEEYEGITISRLAPDKTEEFVRCSAEGFLSGGRPRILLETLALIAAMRPDTRLYIALIDGRIAGSAGLALTETSQGGVAHLYIDSTMPEYRGQGVQAALTRARLSDAKREGFDFAALQARQGNGIARNAERAGFSLAYSKPTFSKSFK
jgi:GNAT superfamily N-acetyltransferase